jgi:uncharacterized membrane protein
MKNSGCASDYKYEYAAEVTHKGEYYKSSEMKGNVICAPGIMFLTS